MSEELVLAMAPMMAVGGLLAAMSIVDLVGREPREVVGGWKLPWVVVSLLVPLGPVVYLWFGRRVRRKE